jgi:hypothetical protein
VRELTAEVELLRVSLPEAGILRELDTATIEDLEGVARALRITAEKRLLTVPERVLAGHRPFLAQEGTGAARILPRGRFDTLIDQRGGGAYYSFATRTNDYNQEPDLELQQGYLTSGFYGGADGRVLDLGTTAIEEVEADPERPPSTLDAKGIENWRRLWAERPKGASASDAVRTVPDARVKAETGRTYLVRSILSGEHDVLVVFRLVEEDAHGFALVWRLLRSWEPWEGRRHR